MEQIVDLPSKPDSGSKTLRRTLSIDSTECLTDSGATKISDQKFRQLTRTDSGQSLDSLKSPKVLVPLSPAKSPSFVAHHHRPLSAISASSSTKRSPSHTSVLIKDRRPPSGNSVRFRDEEIITLNERFHNQSPRKYERVKSALPTSAHTLDSIGYSSSSFISPQEATRTPCSPESGRLQITPEAEESDSGRSSRFSRGDESLYLSENESDDSKYHNFNSVSRFGRRTFSRIKSRLKEGKETEICTSLMGSPTTKKESNKVIDNATDQLVLESQNAAYEINRESEVQRSLKLEWKIENEKDIRDNKSESEKQEVMSEKSSDQRWKGSQESLKSAVTSSMGETLSRDTKYTDSTYQESTCTEDRDLENGKPDIDERTDSMIITNDGNDTAEETSKEKPTLDMDTGSVNNTECEPSKISTEINTGNFRDIKESHCEDGWTMNNIGKLDDREKVPVNNDKEEDKEIKAPKDDDEKRKSFTENTSEIDIKTQGSNIPGGEEKIIPRGLQQKVYNEVGQSATAGNQSSEINAVPSTSDLSAIGSHRLMDTTESDRGSHSEKYESSSSTSGRVTRRIHLQRRKRRKRIYATDMYANDGEMEREGYMEKSTKEDMEKRKSRSLVLKRSMSEIAQADIEKVNERYRNYGQDDGQTRRSDTKQWNDEKLKHGVSKLLEVSREATDLNLSESDEICREQETNDKQEDQLKHKRKNLKDLYKELRNVRRAIAELYASSPENDPRNTHQEATGNMEEGDVMKVDDDIAKDKNDFVKDYDDAVKGNSIKEDNETVVKGNDDIREANNDAMICYDEAKISSEQSNQILHIENMNSESESNSHIGSEKFESEVNVHTAVEFLESKDGDVTGEQTVSDDIVRDKSTMKICSEEDTIRENINEEEEAVDGRTNQDIQDENEAIRTGHSDVMPTQEINQRDKEIMNEDQNGEVSVEDGHVEKDCFNRQDEENEKVAKTEDYISKREKTHQENKTTRDFQSSERAFECDNIVRKEIFKREETLDELADRKDSEGKTGEMNASDLNDETETGNKTTRDKEEEIKEKGIPSEGIGGEDHEGEVSCDSTGTINAKSEVLEGAENYKVEIKDGNPLSERDSEKRTLYIKKERYFNDGDDGKGTMDVKEGTLNDSDDEQRTVDIKEEEKTLDDANHGDDGKFDNKKETNSIDIKQHENVSETKDVTNCQQPDTKSGEDDDESVNQRYLDIPDTENIEEGDRGHFGDRKVTGSSCGMCTYNDHDEVTKATQEYNEVLNKEESNEDMVNSQFVESCNVKEDDVDQIEAEDDNIGDDITDDKRENEMGVNTDTPACDTEIADGNESDGCIDVKDNNMFYGDKEIFADHDEILSDTDSILDHHLDEDFDDDKSTHKLKAEDMVTTIIDDGIDITYDKPEEKKFKREFRSISDDQDEIICILYCDKGERDVVNVISTLGCDIVDPVTVPRVTTTHETLLSHFVQLSARVLDEGQSKESHITIRLPFMKSAMKYYHKPVLRKLDENSWTDISSVEFIFEDEEGCITPVLEAAIDTLSTFAIVACPIVEHFVFSADVKSVSSAIDNDILLTSSFSPRFDAHETVVDMLVLPLERTLIDDSKSTLVDDASLLVTTGPLVKIDLCNDPPQPVTLYLPCNKPKSRPWTAQMTSRLSTACSRIKSRAKSRESIHNFMECWYQSDNYLVRYGGGIITMRKQLLKHKDITQDGKIVLTVHEKTSTYMIIETKKEARSPDVGSMIGNLLKMLEHHRVYISVLQRRDKLNQVRVSCIAKTKFSSRLANRLERDFVARRAVFSIKEGDVIRISLRGNIATVPNRKRVLRFYAVHGINLDWETEVLNRYSQRSLPEYCGFVRVCLWTKESPVKYDLYQESDDEKCWKLLSEIPVMLPKEPVHNKAMVRAPLTFRDEGPITVELLKSLARFIGPEWYNFARALNLDHVRIQSIIQQNRHVISTVFVSDLLVTWLKRTQHGKDKAKLLTRALRKCGRHELAEEVEEIDNAYKNETFKSVYEIYLSKALECVRTSVIVVRLWRELARALGLSREEVDEIESSQSDERSKCSQMLATWRRGGPDNGSKSLIRSLRQIGCYYIADHLSCIMGYRPKTWTVNIKHKRLLTE